MANQFTRRDFLRTGTIAGLGMAVGSVVLSGDTSAQSRTDAASMIGYNPGAKDLIKVGYAGIGNQGSGHVNNLLKIEGCQITAVCDIRPERVKWAQRQVARAGFPEPKGYTKGDLDFERMCGNNGKHAASEVNIALSVEDCWKLVEVSEKTRKHCVMQENCCYDFTEMVVMNMIAQGLFGEIMHGECGYLHDLRGLKIHPTFYQGMWRAHQSLNSRSNATATSIRPTESGRWPGAWTLTGAMRSTPLSP